MVSTEGLFVVPPPAKQWQNLAAGVLSWPIAPREISFMHGMHTHRLVESLAPDSPHQQLYGRRRQMGESSSLGRRRFWLPSMSDLPMSILVCNLEQEIEIGPLRCYTKDADARTILAASKRHSSIQTDQSHLHCYHQRPHFLGPGGKAKHT